MAFVITMPCVGVKDTACVAVCPMDCIAPWRDDKGFDTADQLFIDPASCIDCGLCVNECPVGAIYRQDDVPTEWEDYIEKNAVYFKNG